MPEEQKLKIKNQKHYDPHQTEAKWQQKWEFDKVYQPDMVGAKKPYYNLHMFPYPSAEGLHVGNVYAFTGADIHGRFKRQQGYDIFQPFGLDGFGIHSENYALKIGSHPMEQAEKSEKRFYDQVKSLGSGYDWRHTLETYDPDYYRWTQWIFIELFKAGLAYRAAVKVNWCPSCKTVLADEQVIDTQCERCSTVVEKRDLEQWMFRITSYAEKLLEGLTHIDWTEKVKVAQHNWIGKSEGAQITFPILNSNDELAVFTTRPDTLYGATFLVVSPEHQIVNKWLEQPGVQKYVEDAHEKADQERIAVGKEKTGIFSGAYAINPINNKQLPIWIADYVLMGYGTGAIMAVPAHDQRDYDFARKYELPIVQVVEGDAIDSEAYTGSGKLINSGDWDGLLVPQEKNKTIDSLADKEVGERYTTYHLRDWLISRQRYWGPPIPMVYCDSCAKAGKSWFDTDAAKGQKILFTDFAEAKEQVVGWYPEEMLPVELPKIDDYKPLGTGNSPLGNHPEFYTIPCPACGASARRETDVSDTFLDSAWYFFRYISTDDHEHAWNNTIGRVWLPPTIYTGGAEHSVLHLLYARFITKVFNDLGLIKDYDEPFPRFYAHGLIIKDGAKMSKSKGNVVVPDEYIKKYGADTLRSYLMFLGPFNMGGDFRDSGIEGMYRFIKRVWALLTTQTIISTQLDVVAKSELNKAVKGVTEDIEAFRYNTAIAKIMTFYNYLSKKEVVNLEEAKVLLQLFAPFAPHMTEELWQMLGQAASIHTTNWPSYDEGAIEQGDVIIAIQVNGKLRDTLTVSKEDVEDQSKIEKLAVGSSKVSGYINSGKSVKKIIYVPGKILNFVVN